MYIVGHCLSVVDSGTCGRDEMDAFGAVATMLPDILDNHAWGYAACFQWPAHTAVTRFVRAHMVGDWFVHFGENPSRQEREGWAYRQMNYYAELYTNFFALAHTLGCATSSAPTDTRRGFAHTMSEYAVDYRLSRLGRFDGFFHSVQAGLATLGCEDDDRPGSIHWLRDACDAERMPIVWKKVAGQIESFRDRASRAVAPEDFVVFSVIHKLGFEPGLAAARLVGEALNDGARGIGENEIDRHYRQCCDFIACNV